MRVSILDGILTISFNNHPLSFLTVTKFVAQSSVVKSKDHVKYISEEIGKHTSLILIIALFQTYLTKRN